MTEQKEEPKVERKPLADVSPEQMKEFVLGVCDNRIFTDRHLSEDEVKNNLSLVFMPLMFGALDSIQMDTIGCIWEYWSEAGPRSVNGKPIFFSMRLMNVKDTEFAFAQIKKEMSRRENLKLDPWSDMEAALEADRAKASQNQEELFKKEDKANED